MYERKTKDVYEIITDYGYGEEVETTELTLSDAKRQVRAYKDNARGLVNIRIRKRRVPKKPSLKGVDNNG